jgi:predicted CXXCH cytochrome family protein
MPRPRFTLLHWTLTALVFISTPALVVWTLTSGHDPAAQRAAEPLTHREDGYVGSQTCLPCHPDHHSSWERTFHRTMNQLPGPGTVLGRFDGQRVELFGNWARPTREDERFQMEVPDGRGGHRLAEIALCVGSRRYQQYFEEITLDEGTRLERLPLLWHVGAQRWMHLNGVFLEPDNDDWDAHRSAWNPNCAFCHTTGPRPGTLPGSTTAFDSSVAELGIACEACHGPGADHAERFRSPVTRYAAHLSTDEGTGEDHVHHPAELDAARESAVCGQCHGQRLPRDFGQLSAWLVKGPSYRPGDLLEEHVSLITRETPSIVSDQPELLSQRFWADGTARLTAYEYQGLVASPCHAGGQFSCGSCHDMHGGDPRGMIHEPMRGDEACLQCHQELGRDLQAHTMHAPESSGSRCMACHMPRIVYGVLGIHRSHRVELPDPARDGEAGRPHACTLCHLDRSLAWSAAQLDHLWGADEERYRPPTQRHDRAPVDLPDGIASILSGDAVQRAVYAAAGPGAAEALARDGFWRAHLLVTLGDGYPAVRWLALQSLLSMERRAPSGLAPALERFQHDAPIDERLSRLKAMLGSLAGLAPGLQSPPPDRAGELLVGPNGGPRLDEVRDLLDLQADRVISIGE